MTTVFGGVSISWRRFLLESVILLFPELEKKTMSEVAATPLEQTVASMRDRLFDALDNAKEPIRVFVSGEKVRIVQMCRCVFSFSFR